MVNGKRVVYKATFPRDTFISKLSGHSFTTHPFSRFAALPSLSRMLTAFPAYFTHVFAVPAHHLPAFTTGFPCFVAVPLMRYPLLVCRTAALACNALLLLAVHGGKTTIGGTSFF